MSSQAHGEVVSTFYSGGWLDESEWMRLHVAAAAYELDVTVGALVDSLRSNGLLDTTVLIFASDNGATLGQEGGGSNWPLRGSKFTPYEARGRTTP